MPGGMEMMVILLIAVLLFGANKIPKLARSTGEAMGEFKKGRQEIETELEEMTDPDVSPSESEVSRTDASVDADASDTSEA
nr:twin-arginine translocase TatA/TatE family subunit [Halorussus halobius]